ncbi:ubiquinol oxidase subunit II [Roseibium sediminicola]|uniref:Ubiquinol oxidase subunit 2 n=1 Tax=Roseibium sediminicola TaxID=2933272 RepID=A0ABT0GZ40_9HYPH|nr:ubiquinol oxidase subunit II [Roseibium sp. CAU 1639]MCK7614505.1 ubiquinol oxidase subunit II [Roseibium sp. CAU 1639]
MFDVIAGSCFRRIAKAAPVSLLLFTGIALSGCALSDAPVLHPKGPIALAERDLLFTAFWLMMIVAIPAILLTLLFAWRYRRDNGADHAPDWDGSNAIEAVVWLVPAAIVIVIGTLVWESTHRLDPYKALASDKPEFKVQAVALDWKWLFLYPELGTASVNELAFPADRPLSIEITSDTVMNSLMIPALGGQIYAMAGMRSELNLIADGPGVFMGRNTMYSGDGFSDQHFKAHALNEADFKAWQDKVSGSGTALDAAAYAELHKKSVANPVTHYGSFEPDLFMTILKKYAPAGTPQHQAAEDTGEGAS